MEKMIGLYADLMEAKTKEIMRYASLLKEGETTSLANSVLNNAQIMLVKLDELRANQRERGNFIENQRIT